MKNRKANIKWNAPVICFILFAFIMTVLFIQFTYLSLSKKIYGIDMKKFASSRNTVATVVTAKRGNIYDVNGAVLAQNITSYTLIAYLDPKRTSNELDPKHVIDKEYTATKLASVLGEQNYDYIYERLNNSSKQVEFGSVGKNLTELTKIAIEALELPGISFVETVKRYYPNGDFASYLIGYAKQYTKINIQVGKTYDLYSYYKNYFDNYDNVNISIDNDKIISIKDRIITGKVEGTSLLYIKTNKDVLATIQIKVTNYEIYQVLDTAIIGELGIESYFEDDIQGSDGYLKYQQDKYGYQIPDTPEERVEAINGSDIYLTIDSNIQRFAENSINAIEKTYDPEFSIVTVMDAKTGDLLASATSPSYNPNSLQSDMTYQNSLVSYAYEPGSVMKIYTYMCAIETGNYDGGKTYLSGSYEFEDGTVMHDWNPQGWGYLSYDNGFNYSSNVAVINIIKDYLSSSQIRNCLEKFGFGSKTGLETSRELDGNIDFQYETEVMSAGFGQGIVTTPIQQLQALTIIANDGIILKPHVISKIVNSYGEEKITKITKTEKLVSSNTINKIKDLMEIVISPTGSTGKQYYIEEYDIIGKTGTAQIYENGKYIENSYINSVALMYPKNDPQIIIYAVMKKPNSNSTTNFGNIIKELIKNTSKYKKMFTSNESDTASTKHIMDSYISDDVDEVVQKLTEEKLNVVVIGDGKHIVNQYPKSNESVLQGDKIFLITDGQNKSMINISNWSRSDALRLCNLLSISCTFDGIGFVVNQSIKEGELINEELTLNILLGNMKEI